MPLDKSNLRPMMVQHRGSCVGFIPGRTEFGFVGTLGLLWSLDSAGHIYVSINQPRFTQDVFDPAMIAMSGVQNLAELVSPPQYYYTLSIGLIIDNKLRLMSGEGSVVYDYPDYPAVTLITTVDVVDRDLLRGVPIADNILLSLPGTQECRDFFQKGNEEWEQTETCLPPSSQEWKRKMTMMLTRTLCPQPIWLSGKR
jgi:hypothetical protein